MSDPISKAELFEKRLRESLSIDFLQVENHSAQHAGHAGDDGSGESHFVISIKSPDLEELAPLQKHRKVFDCIGKNLVSNTHSISLKIV